MKKKRQITIVTPPYPSNNFQKLAMVSTVKTHSLISVIQKRYWRIKHKQSVALAWCGIWELQDIFTQSFMKNWGKYTKEQQGALLAFIYGNQCLLASLRALEYGYIKSSFISARNALENVFWAGAILTSPDSEESLNGNSSYRKKSIEPFLNRIPACRNFYEKFSNSFFHEKFGQFIFQSNKNSTLISVDRSMAPCDDLIYCLWCFALATLLKTSSSFILTLNKIVELDGWHFKYDIHSRLSILETKQAGLLLKSEIEYTLAKNWLKKFEGKLSSDPF